VNSLTISASGPGQLNLSGAISQGALALAGNWHAAREINLRLLEPV
jgi:hypothetical protein